MITEDQSDNRVETEQILSRSVNVNGSRRYTTNAPIATKKGGKGYDDFDYVADNSDIKSEAGETGPVDNSKRPVAMQMRRLASETPSLFSGE